MHVCLVFYLLNIVHSTFSLYLCIEIPKIGKSTSKINQFNMKYFFTLLFLLTTLGAAAQNPVDVPYKQTFDNASSMNDFIIIDANDDDDTWFYNSMMRIASCSGSDEGESDDYLLLPLRLQAYTQYEVTFACSAAQMCTCRFDTWLADAPNLAGIKTRLSERKEVKYSDRNVQQRVNFSVTADGIYYFALHNCSDAHESSLFLYSLAVDCTTATAPKAPEFMSMVPGEMGDHVCDITLRMPTETLLGTPIEDLDHVDIYRNDVRVETLKKDADGKALEPGAVCKWHDKELSNRMYTYRAIAVTPEGVESAPAIGEVYVGFDQPGRVKNLKIREDLDEPGKIIITWDAPTEGIHGGYLNSATIYYTVSKSYYEEPTTRETMFVDHVDVSKGQTYAAYSIYAQNEIGSNRSDWQTISTHAGPAEVAPWAESYPGVSCKNGPWLTHVTGDTEIGQASWYISSPVGDIPDQDGDGGYTYFFTSAIGKSARYTSPKIDISHLSAPALSFWLYEKGNADKIEVGVMADMTEWQTVETIVLDSRDGWKRHIVDLTPYLDTRFIQIGFNGVSVEETDNITAVDNISIRNASDYDLSIQSYKFPARVDVGRDNAFTLVVRNRGAESLAAGSYAIHLYRQDSDEEEAHVVYTLEGTALAADMTDEFTLKDNPGIFTPDCVKYSAEIVLAGDATPDDNVVAPQETVVFKPSYPVPTDLAGRCDEKGVQMTWQTPDVGEGSALPVTDSFEDYPIFSITDCGDWTLYDGDEQFTITMALSTGVGVVTLDYEHAGEPMAWQVFSPIDAGIPYTSWDPHDGELMMVCMGNALNNVDKRYHDNDDWLISPALSGREQSISFFAKCGMGSAYQPELLEVLYSTTDNDPASFVSPGAPIELYNVSGWEEQIVTLPAGAKHFALRCVSEHKFALLVDDVTYHPAGKADITLLGYNVYRKGAETAENVRINAELLPTPVFTDATAEAGKTYEYCVTAVYTEGESLPSMPFVVIYDPNGIAQIVAPQVSENYYDAHGRRVSTNTQGIRISRQHKVVK